MTAAQQCLVPGLFAGRTAFVTGGGSGINLGIARTFATLGARVAICGRDEQRLAAARASLETTGARVHAVSADVRDPDALAAALTSSASELGPADVVVAGAAGNFLAPAEEISSAGFRAVVDIDLTGSFHTASLAFPQLRETRGALLLVSAGQSTQPYLWQAHVGAAKAGIESLTRSLALEWGRHGIRVNAIVPGPVAGTEGMRRLCEQVGEETWTSASPLNRFATVDEIAAIAAVLASPLASYMTGAIVAVDGGISLAGSGSFNATLAAGRD